MADENGSSYGLNIFKNLSIAFTSLFRTIQKRINEQEHFEIFNRTYKFNTSCITETQCENTAMFCNLTTNRCQCALIYSWNETVGICEYQHEYFTKWLEKNSNKSNDNQLFNASDQLSLGSKYTIPLPIIIIMAIGAMCYLFCVAYICFGQDKIDEDKSLYAALRKQKEQTCKIQTSIVEHVL